MEQRRAQQFPTGARLASLLMIFVCSLFAVHTVLHDYEAPAPHGEHDGHSDGVRHEHPVLRTAGAPVVGGAAIVVAAVAMTTPTATSVTTRPSRPDIAFGGLHFDDDAGLQPRLSTFRI